MLTSFRIRNFALIEDITIELGEGLNILSGETGAGKSIIVQALELLLGGRGSSELIRQGEEEAEVIGVFEEDKKEDLILRRVISKSGKNKAYQNERPVPVATIEETGEKLVDIATQHAHQVLLQPELHLSLLDDYAELQEALKKYGEVFEKYRLLNQEREGLAVRERQAREQEEFLRFQAKEIQEAGLTVGEEEKLQTEREVVRHAVRLGEICMRGEEVLESGEDSISDRVALVAKEVQAASQIDAALSEVLQQIEGSLCQLQESAKFLRRYGEKLSFDPGRLQEVEDRLALISRLRKKYGGSIESVLSKGDEIAQSLKLLDNFSEEIQKRDKALSALDAQLTEFAKSLSLQRKTAASRLSREIEREMRELGMPSAKFSVPLTPLPERNERGLDATEFLFAPNPGEGFRPLARIASGGELSRAFLAMKKVLNVVRGSATCIFDEVDVGIGGGIAEVVGRNLSLLARKKQVLCITHLPQIACYANHHYVIQKRTSQGRTQTHVQRLQKDQREEEIARMLAGIKITDKAMDHAREMLKTASGRS